MLQRLRARRTNVLALFPQARIFSEKFTVMVVELMKPACCRLQQRL